MSKVRRLPGGQLVEDRQRLQPGEIPGEADQPHKSVGDDLRAARLERGDELGRVSRALRIRKDYLEAIESDCPDKLPGRAYAIGFLRSYAEYLGLDSPALVSRYKRQIAGQSEYMPQVGAAPEPEQSWFGFGWTAVAVSVAALAIYGVYEFAHSSVSSGPVAPSSVAVSAVANRARPHGQVLKQVQQQPPLADRSAGTTTSLTALAVPSGLVPQQAAVPAGQVFGAQNLNVRLILHAHALTHVLVQDVRGRVFINRLLHPGDAYRVPNLVGLSLTTPDGGAVSLELDGRDIGAAGRAGQITEALSLDPRAVVERGGSGSLYDGNKVTQ